MTITNRALSPRTDIAVELRALQDLTAGELRARYLDVFGAPSASHNKQYLYKRIAYRLQEILEGRTLSPQARATARELAQSAGARVRPPSGALAQIEAPAARPRGAPPSTRPRDTRLPAAGTVLVRMHEGTEHRVLVGERDFECAGKRYPSLSAVARAITGTPWNGYAFFGLTGSSR